jgi:hypothetical protein
MEEKPAICNWYGEEEKPARELLLQIANGVCSPTSSPS